MSQAVDKAALHRRAGRRHDDRDRLGGHHRGSDRWGEMRYDDVDVELDQLASECGGAITFSFGVTPFDRDTLALDIAEWLQTSSEGVGKWMRRCSRHQHTDSRQPFCFLRKCPTVPAKHSGGKGADKDPSVQRASSFFRHSLDSGSLH